MNFLSQANELFRNGFFELAEKKYKLCASNKHLESQATFNAALCRKRLESNFQTLNRLNELSIEAILSSDLPSISKAVDFDFTSPWIKEHLKCVQNFDYSINSIKPALISALYAPFNRDLLMYLYFLLKKNGLENLLITADKTVLSPNLGNLTRFVSDKDFWLKNRQKLPALYNDIDTIFNNFDFFQEPQELNFGEKFVLPRLPRKEYSYSWGDKKSKKSLPKSIFLGTIFLNEKKFLGLNLLQHYMFCDNWVLVEGACKGYPTRKVTEDGLSLDGSENQVRLFPDRYGKIEYIQHGWTEADGEDAKSELRNRYISRCSHDYLVVVDADEFYKHEDLSEALYCFNDESVYSVTLPQVHFWKNTSQFITGEYYDISHTRIYRYIPGAKYIKNHNFPEVNGTYIHGRGNKKYQRTVKNLPNGVFTYEEPRCYHMGFAKDFDDMRDKSDYYINRGEDVTRVTTTQSRAAWFDDNLPDKCRVRRWGGYLPEVLVD